MMRIAALFALILIVTGCAVYSLVEPQRTDLGDLYTVDPQIAWSSSRTGKVEIWTVDGPSLHALRFVKGLEDGEGFVKAKDEKNIPKFKKHMTPSEIMEFVVDSLTLAGAQKVKAMNLRPEKFGDAQGFRFEMAYLTKEGLEEQGLVTGTVVEKKLHLIMYTGVKAHYYPKCKEDAERIIQSIKMKKRKA